MIEIKVFYLVDNNEDDIIHKTAILLILGKVITVSQLKKEIAEILASENGIYLFSMESIKIEQISIIRGEMLDELKIDQSYSLQLRNTQTQLIPIKKLNTSNQTTLQHLTISGFNLMDSEIQISCEILDIEGRLKLFPNFQGSKISVLIFRPNPKIHFTIGGDCSALNIKSSVIDKLRLQELCVGAPAEIIGRIFKSYKRSDNQELLILEDGSVIGSLDIHEVELHGPNTTIGIHADASSKILSIEIADNTKIKNRFVATEKS